MIHSDSLMKGKLLLIEDDLDLGSQVRDFLVSLGFDTQWVPSSFGAIDCVSQEDYDMLLVDIQLPGIDGFELIGKLKEIRPSLKFMFLSARNFKTSRLEGLRLGAEDYVTKPFDVEELAWRINNILNRDTRCVMQEMTLGDVQLLYNKMELCIGNRKVSTLTTREFELWKYLLENADKVLKRDDILLEVWGDNDYFLGRSLDVFISKVRKMLKHSQTVTLDTIFKVGFILKNKEIFGR